jgi:uncharacterized protein YdaU (DUF1376 family)
LPQINRNGWPRPELHLPAAHQKGLQVNFYSFHIGDYASATRHLTWDEDAAYRRLLDAYYTREMPIPLDLSVACRLVSATVEAHCQAVKTVLEEFFTETAEGWVHDRCEAEIALAQDKKSKARESAMASVRARQKKAEEMKALAERASKVVPTEPVFSERSTDVQLTLNEGLAPNPNPNPIKNLKSKPFAPTREKISRSEPNLVRFVNGSECPAGKFEVAKEIRMQWVSAYPGVQIGTELEKAAAWAASNPTKRKKDWRRFLNNWMSRAQERTR